MNREQYKLQLALSEIGQATIELLIDNVEVTSKSVISNLKARIDIGFDPVRICALRNAIVLLRRIE